jgi:hypothetical protein
MKLGHIHARKIDSKRSNKLRLLLYYISDRRPHGTRELRDALDICAVGTAMNELKFNKYQYVCRSLGSGRFEYTYRGEAPGCKWPLKKVRDEFLAADIQAEREKRWIS